MLRAAVMAVALVAAMVGAASAQGRLDHEEAGLVVDISRLAHGSYLLEINSRGVSVRPVVVVVPAVNPIPVPPPGPGPAPAITERARAIQAAAARVDDPKRAEVSQALAMLYSQMAEQAESGAIAPAQLPLAIRTATDMALLQLKANKAAWQGVRDLFGEQWAAVARSGGSSAEYAKLLREASAGLDASAPNRAIDPAVWAMILEIVKLILSLFVKAGPAVAVP